MELRSIQSPAVSSVPRKGFIGKPFLYGQLIRPFDTKRRIQPNPRKLKAFHFKAQASGATRLGSQPIETSSKDANQKDKNLVFVAGATGKVGSRTVRELLKLGFNVRAGVRSTQRAEPLVKSVQQMKLDEALPDGTQPIEKLELVECDLEKPEQIGPALGRAATVICCIGASEKEVLDITGPYRIDFLATKNLIDAATIAKVKHFILVTSLGTNKVGFPAAVLNLFWGVLIWKRKAEEALLASGIPYTIVRPGGMERPTDAYKETHNITLSPEDTLFGGQVSNLQVAELMAFMVRNPGLSYYKVVEVIAETTAPLTPMGDLLAKLPSQHSVPDQAEEPEASKESQPNPKSIIFESPSISSETESQSKPASTRPLSPYTVYEGLKPPVSPIPTAPSSSNVVAETVSKPTSADSESTTESVSTDGAAVPASVSVGVQKTRPLSPFAVYEGLKPPTSPTPTPSGARGVPSDSYTTTEVPSKPTTVNDVSKTEDVSAVQEDPPQPSTSNHSPYHAYDNLRPPTSPTPSSPSTAPEDNGYPITGMPGNSSDTAVKLRPLSPFTMYEELKPPSSPTPSSPNK